MANSRTPLVGDGARVATAVPTGEIGLLSATPRPGALAGRAFAYWLHLVPPDVAGQRHLRLPVAAALPRGAGVRAGHAW